jgi:hypothetical protein
MRYITNLLLVLLAAPLMAQMPPETELPEPSPARESFVIQPAEVEKGARDFAIRMVSNDPAAFSNSSSKPPAVKFGEGVTLKPGSFRILNQNEAECRIDVDDDALGTVEVSIELYSVNGTKVLRTLRATLGIKGTGAVSGSQAKVGAESIKLVQVNVTDPQAAGVIVITGAIAGTVSITAPTGTNFAETPTAVIDNGEINSPALSQANTVFNFSIGNASLANVTVRVTSIKYNTRLFGVTGGMEGDLVCEVTGGALSNQAALVVNAFTARSATTGSNDNTEPPAPTSSESGGSSNQTGSGRPSTGAVNTATRNLDNNTNNRRNRDNRRNDPNRGSSVAPSQPRPAGSTPPAPRPAPPAPPTNNAPPPAPGPAPGGGGVSNAGGAGGATMGGTGSMKEERRPPRDAAVDAGRQAPPRELIVTPGLYFCDKDFKPVSALVLDKIVSAEAGGRVWILLKLEKDKQPDKVETVTVKLTVGGTTRELVLTETGKNTGEFRCGKDGILVVANENPNSNEVEKEPEPPKPRFPK